MRSRFHSESLVRTILVDVVPELGATAAVDGLAALLAGARGLPTVGREARLARRVAGILGRALPDPRTLDVRILGQVHEALVVGEGRSRQKATGSFYTPREVTRTIIERAISDPLRRSGDVLSFHICDPAMGSGFFLVEALEALALAAPGISRGDLARACLYGMDLDEEAVRIAASSVWIAAGDPGLARRDLSGHLRVGDGLLEGWSVSFDAVVGNPPYGAVLSPQARRRVKEEYLTTGSGYSNSALHFVERAYDLLAPRGVAGLIVPRSIAYSRGWGPAAEIVLPGLREVIDASRPWRGVRLEQVILVFGRARERRATYATGRIEAGRVECTARPPRSAARATGSLLVGATRDEIRVLERLRESCRPLREIAESFRGLGMQRFADPLGDIEAIDGRSIARYLIRSPLPRYRSPGILPPKAGRLVRPKIVSQNVVAHVRKPDSRLVLMSAMDEVGRVTLDTVTNTFVTDPGVDPWFVLGLLNSRFLSWYAFVFVFGRAVRTMHLDAGYIGRLPVPRATPAQQGQVREVARLAAAGRQVDEDMERMVRALYGVGSTPR